MIPEKKEFGLSPENIVEIGLKAFEERFQKECQKIDKELRDRATALVGILGIPKYKAVVSTLEGKDRELVELIINYYRKLGWEVNELPQIGGTLSLEIYHPFRDENKRELPDFAAAILERTEEAATTAMAIGDD